MYHIPNDKRAIRSAQLLLDGLMDCLKEKKLNEITISDINKKSYVSRATFYRLFDSISDILVYYCDIIFEQMKENFSKPSTAVPKEQFTHFVEEWMEHHDLLTVLSQNNRMDILDDASNRHKSIIQDILLPHSIFGASELDYLSHFMSGLLSISFNVWCQHGKKESPEQFRSQIKHCFEQLNLLI
jgi:AcrR family transcriptional regulator